VSEPTCISIPVDLNFTNAKVFRDSALRDIQADTQNDVLLDFKNAETIDSSAIGVLVAIAKSMHDDKRHLRLVNLNQELYELFCETDLDKIFTIETSEKVYEAIDDIFEESSEVRLSINTEQKRHCSVLVLSGLMNHPSGARYFKKTFYLLLVDSARIVLDLEELTFFDSLNVGMLISLQKMLKQTGGELRVCAANAIIQDVFETLHLGSFIQLYPTREQAVASWS